MHMLKHMRTKGKEERGYKGAYIIYFFGYKSEEKGTERNGIAIDGSSASLMAATLKTERAEHSREEKMGGGKGG